ncbi:MAG: VOC family protein [Bacteroidetes bacterium]|nr:MAG: VOC family protein [Bacteroidota bacterium]
MNRVVHFEIPAEDPEKITTFFSSVFGWKFSRWGEEAYWLAETGESNEPGINGAVMKRRDPAQPIVNTLNVEDVSECARKLEAAGGEVVVPKMTIPGVGYLIYFKDPEGNIHGAMQSDPQAK